MAAARRGIAIRQATREESSPLGIRNESPRTRLASNFAKATLADAKKPSILASEKKKMDASQLLRNPQMRPSARAQLTQDVSKVVADAALAAREGALPRIGSARPARALGRDPDEI